MVVPAPLEQQLVRLVMSTSWMARALQAARDVDPPDWLIGAGAIRSLVWDHLHGLQQPDLPKDIDLVFFDACALGEERERDVADGLRELAPDLPWDVKNQAAVDLWYPQVFGVEVRPLASSADAVST